MDYRKVAGLKRSLSSRLDHYLDTIEAIVNCYFLAEVLAFNDHQNAYLIHDWCSFCVSKSCQSLATITLILKSGYPEDALILLRSVYECYLSIVFILNNPDRIDDFIQKPVGILTGRYHHPKTKKKRTDYRRIVIKETGEVIPYNVTVRQLAKGSPYPSDIKLYDFLYPFLSEMVHPHILNSGNYRHNIDDWRFCHRQKHDDLAPWVLTLYIYTLILAECYDLEDLDQPENSLLKRNIRKGAEILDKSLSYLSEIDRIDKTELILLNERFSETTKAKWFFKSN